MASFYAHHVSLTPTYQPLSSFKLLGNIEVTALPTNVGLCYFKSTQDGTDVTIQAGEFHRFENIDLRDIFMKGLVGDDVTIVGEVS